MKTLSIVLLLSLLISCDRKSPEESLAEKSRENALVTRGLASRGNQCPKDGEVIKKYPNGKIKKKYHCHQKMRHGKLEAWYENGKKEKEEFYKEGVLHGKKIFWLETGKKFSEDNYKLGKRNGKSIEWYSNGNKWSQLN